MIRRLRPFVLLLAVLLPALPASATCGGGGGGGVGGVTMGSSDIPMTYRVSWKILGQGAETPRAPEAALVLYWFPTTPEEAKASELQTSRSLSLAGARCVAMALVTPDNQALHTTFKIAGAAPIAVLATADGTELGRVVANDGNLVARPVEKLLDSQIDKQEDSLDALLKGAEKKAAQDHDGAVADYQKVWEQRCLFPKLGKKAAKGLKKLGVTVEEAALRQLGPDSHPENAAKVEKLLKAGLAAELGARYHEAERLYSQATALDPADATALRFLGELYRHQTGEWDKAKVVFERLLSQPADPIARAVAMHGLGKMTIHAGRYADGLALFEKSIATYPLPITYRNLAVYWFSEKQEEKAAGFMRQALALDPQDGYNQIFSAVYLAAAGHKEEAAQVAMRNESVLEASYNLAAIWAQSGDRKKAMELLRRHFYDYEKFDAVRGMEMQEARDDYMFASLHDDPQFIELTKLATRHKM
jgi:tetratricopeptide (TPR) repeat protein